MPAKTFKIVRGLSVFAALACCAGCKHGNPLRESAGLVVSSDLPLRTYVHFAIAGNGQADTRFYFPLLQIYDRNGSLVYTGHNAQQNSRLLDSLPDSVHNLSGVAGAMPLGEVIKEIPQFEASRSKLLSSHRATVVSVFLEDCHACSTQEEAIDSTQDKLRDQAMNLLIIHVSRPT